VFPHFVPPFGIKTMVETTKSKYVNENQISDQDTGIQMEVNSGQPYVVEEVSTRTDLVIKIEIEIEHLFNTKIETKTNIIDVEEVVSFVDPRPRPDFMAHDSAPLACQQTLNDQGAMDMVE